MASPPLQAICAHSAALFAGKVSACTTQSPRGDGSEISCGPKTSRKVIQFVASSGFALVTVSLEIVAIPFSLARSMVVTDDAKPATTTYARLLIRDAGGCAGCRSFGRRSQASV